jgi:molecular chaperone GrpE
MQDREASPDLAVPAVQESEAPTCPPKDNGAVTIDRLQRALADSENAQRRAQRLADDGKRYAIAAFAERLLPIADNLARAIAAAEGKVGKAAENTALVVGVRATERMLTDALAHGGVHRMKALGTQFDPALHEAVTVHDDPAFAPGRVAKVLEGWLHDP